jgi:outer membrane receptor protein involved in Fe transport
MKNIAPLNRFTTGFRNNRRSSQWRLAILAAASAHCALAVLGQAPGTTTAKALGGSGSTNQMSEVIVTGNYTDVIPTEPIQSVVGFGKTLVETPRSVTVISAELLNSAGIENVEDLYQIAPSTYTNFRFGLQGGINVRNQAGDYYFRGIKKPDPQGNYRTIFTAFDSIEIVRGPASPIFGGGRIGGYLNFNPKTARSTTGKYLEKSEGKVSLSVGSWDRRVATLDYSGPVNGLPGDRKGGFYYFGYFEDSGSFYETAFDKHFINQFAFSADINDQWRLETGAVAQLSKGGLNGGINRVTQELFTQGKYWKGNLAVPLDTDGNGKISERELFGSRAGTATYNPVFVNFGTISTPSQLASLKKQAVDATGKPNGPLVDIVTGKPIGTGTSALTRLPEPWQLDYSSFKLVDVDYSKTLGEDYYQADVYDFFLDTINDGNERLTMRNQLYYHFYNQVKDGRNPFSQIQEPSVFEEKFVITHDADWMPSWWDAKFLASPNVRFTDTYRENTTNSDFDQRRDLMSGPDGGYRPNDTFYSFLDRRGLDGSAITQINSSKYWESGVGLLTDQTFLDKLNLVAGGRFDHVEGNHFEPAGVFRGKNAANIGTTASLDQRLTQTGTYSSGRDSALSWNSSVSYGLPYNIRPYFTIAQQAALIMDASDASVARSSWQNGAFGNSELLEAGIKSSLFKDKLFLTVAAFRQSRIAFTQGDAEASVDKTESEGVETEVRWAPNRNFSLVGSVVFSQAQYLAGSDQSVRINGRYAGFSDVIDPATGQVLVPAEAFGWGGVPQVRILGGDVYPEVPGIPDKIINLFATYTHDSGLGGSFGVTHQGGFSADRTLIWVLPEATVLNASLFYSRGQWSTKLDFKNITDELFFVRGANNGMIVGVRQPFNVEFTIARAF